MSVLWLQSPDQVLGLHQFFSIMLGHDSLANFFKTNFNLMQIHKYSITELENMISWERSLYIDLLKEHIREENQKQRDLQNMRRRNG